MTYREPDLASVSARLDKIEKTLGEHGDSIRGWPDASLAFKERWAVRTEGIRAAAFAALCTLGVTGAVFGIVFTTRGCNADAEEARQHADERCDATCIAIGMEGAALERNPGAPSAAMDCYCGLGTRLVTIHSDGTVSGIDVATGVSFGPTE